MHRVTKKEDPLELFHSWSVSEQQPINAFVKGFKKKYPRIKVTENAVLWWKFVRAMKIRMEMGTPPDIISVEIGQRLRRFANAGHLVDLTPIWEEGLSNVFSDVVVRGCISNGRIYGIPVKRYTFVVWYLRDMFKKHGVKPPETWDEFMDACEKFKRAGVVPIATSDSGMFVWFNHLLVRICGPKFYNRLMRGDESWTDGRVIETYELLRELTDEFFCPHPFGYFFHTSWGMLNRGKAAMELQGDWLNGMWQREYGYTPGKEFDCFFLPPIDPKISRAMVMGGNVWAMSRRARHPKEAEKFLRYAGSREGHKLLARGGMGIAAREDIGKEAYDPVTARIIAELHKSPAVLEMGCAFPQSLITIEEYKRMMILLGPKFTKNEIKAACAEINIVAKEYFRRKQKLR